MRLVAAYLVLVGAYLLFAGSVDWVEVAFAAAFPLPAVALVWGMRRCGPVRFTGRVPWARVVGLPLLHLFTDSAAVGRALLVAMFGDRRGGMLTQPFADAHDPDGATRRALVTLGISFAPNSYVVHVPPEGEALVLHHLAPHRASANSAWPL